MKTDKPEKLLPFVNNLSIALSLICIAGIATLCLITDSRVNEEIKTRAKSYLNSVLIIQKWNSQYNGVYVERKKGFHENPYLTAPDLKGLNGKTYTLKNSSLMAIEISRLTENNDLFSYKLRSLRPINPGNTPDEFETFALASFDHGAKESYDKIYSGGRTEFRYMEPLYVTDECLVCHGGQGYRNGDVRGGISVSFDITSIEKNLSYTKYAILSLCFLTAVMIAGVFFISMKKLRKKVEYSGKEIERLAVSDDLTSLYNRRFFFKKLDEEFERTRRYGQTLSLIRTDIDNFKTINDSYGHQTGDMVLSAVAKMIKSRCRESDTPARYSGEEFAIILPATTREGAAAMAEKLRKAVAEYRIDGYDFTLTISMGISVMTPEDAYSPTTLIYDADRALDRAKADGRNRFVIA